jgi:hypothetical protein
MDKKSLLRSAGQIGSVSDEAIREYEEKSDRLVAGVNEAIFRRPDLLLLVGESNSQMMKDNHANHARFMLSIMKHFDPEVFVETILWVFRAYRSHGFRQTYWAAQINAWIMTLKETCSDATFREVFPLYNWIQVNIPVFDRLSGYQEPAAERGQA